MNQIILYGLGGASIQYCAVQYYAFFREATIKDIVKEALYMREYNPTIESVYAIDNRFGLKSEFIRSVKDTHNPIESRIIFKDTLEREGIKII